MELNTSGINKAYPEMNPGPEMLAMIATALEVRLVDDTSARVVMDGDEANRYAECVLHIADRSLGHGETTDDGEPLAMHGLERRLRWGAPSAR